MIAYYKRTKYAPSSKLIHIYMITSTELRTQKSNTGYHYIPFFGFQAPDQRLTMNERTGFDDNEVSDVVCITILNVITSDIKSI